MAVSASNELFRAGRATYLEVITAQKSVLEAEIYLLRLHGERLRSSIDLYRALCGVWDKKFRQIKRLQAGIGRQDQ